MITLEQQKEYLKRVFSETKRVDLNKIDTIPDNLITKFYNEIKSFRVSKNKINVNCEKYNPKIVSNKSPNK